MVVTEFYECEECLMENEVEIEVSLTIEEAAEELLSRYGNQASIGDQIKLENAIRRCLAEEIGVPAAKIY